MKKPIGKRIAGFLAAAALAVTSVSGSFTDVLRAKAAGAGGDFSLTEAELDALRDNKQYTNDLSASISFKNADGSTNTTALPDNTYYLLVHVEGKDSDSYTYADGASHDHYKLVEIENNGGSFSTGRFAVVPATQVNGGWSSPDGKSLDGKILKAKEGWLTVDAVTNDWGKDKYEVTSTIEDFKVEVTSKPSVQPRSNEFALTATKAVASAEVRVTDYNDTPTPVQNGTTSRYFVLGYVVDGNATETSYKRADVKGWAIEEVDLTNSSSAVAAFTSFHKFGLDGSDATAAAYTLGANDKVYIRVFSTTGKDLTTFKQCKDNANDDAVFDGIPDYIPGGDSQTFATFKHNKTEYKIALEFDAAPDFAADDHIYLRATAHHASEDDYYVEPLVFSGATQNIITVQDADINLWVNGNEGTGQRYNGNPSEDVKVEIVSATSDRSFSNIVKNEKVVAAAEGDIVDGFKVSYVGQEKSEDTDTHTTTYTNTVRFTKVTATKGYTYKEILGGISTNMGVTADRFEQGGHMQTNFAANYYDGNGDGFRPDLSAPNGGSIYIGNFTDFPANDKSRAAAEANKITAAAKGLINFDQNDFSDHSPYTDSYYAKLFTPFENDEALMDNPREVIGDAKATAERYVVRQQMSTENINKIVNNAINHFTKKSDELAANDANLTPLLIDNKYVVDGTAYPEGVTLYVDADKMIDKEGSLPTLLISLRKDQNVVFNFKNADKVKIGQFYMRTLVDGKWVNDKGVNETGDYGVTGESQEFQSDFNNWIDKYVMRHVIFNMNKATDVEVGNSAGLFVVKDPESITKMEGTTTGWMATAGYFRKGSGEWHFPYSELEEIEPDSDVDEFSVAKVDENGEPVKGAVLTIKIEPTSAAEAIRLAEDNFSCADGKATYTDDTITWTTGEKPLIIKGMQNAKVTIKETTTPQGYETAAEATYTVKDGKLQDAEGKEVTSAKITVVDAEKTYSVSVSKVDIADSKEVAGARIQVLDASGTKVDEWTSSARAAHQISNLKAGVTYTLRETVAPEGYTVTTDITFTVDNTGKVTTAAKTTTDGVILIEDAKTSVKVSKVDIAGGKEVAGARIQILEGTAVVKEWTSTEKAEEITGLKTGVTYTLRETVAPKGYTVATDTTFSIDKNGKVTATATQTEDGTILVEDAKTSIKVSKVDIAGGKEVAGARIQILEGTAVVKEWTSTEKAEEITGLKTGVTYTLRETVAPKGYTVAADTTFSIDKNGKVTATATTTSDGVLLVEDAKTSIKVSKVDIAGGKEVAGARIQILEGTTVVKEWTSTEKAEEITGLETGVEYTLRETVAPKGYTVATDTTFSIDKNGKVTTTAKTATDGVILIEDAKTSVKVSKVDIAGGKEVAGATIQILKGTTVVKEWTSTDKAEEITGLETGVEYTLRETVAPKGYTVATDTTFSIDKNGKVTTTAKTATDGVILIEDAKTSVKVSKVDIAGGKEVAGARIQILEGTAVVKEWTSTEKAEEITGLKTGVTYTLRETVAPKGYTVATDTTFSIDKNGKVTATATQTEDGTILVEDAKTSIKVSKVDIAGGEEVAGARIQILEGTTVVKEWTSTEKAEEITGLKTGVTYTLRETVAPKGYTVATDTTFSIDKNGKVTATATQTEDGTILVEDAKTSIKVSKVDIADGKEVAGAKIQILEGTKVVEEWTSTDKAHEITGLKTGVTYTLRETVAPKGYKTTTDTTFSIDKDGKVTTTASVNKDGVILVEDEAEEEEGQEESKDTTVTISKKEMSGKDELEGAELTIFEGDKNSTKVAKDADGKELTWTSGKTAKEVTLKDGTYTLKETGGEFTIGNKTYKVTDSSITFEVKNGEVVKYEIASGKVGKVTIDGTDITVEDAFEEKSDEDEKKDDEKSDEDEKKDDEKQSDDEKKDDEQQSDDEKKDDEQQSDDEKKDDEKQSDDEKKDDEQQSDDEKKDDEQQSDDEKKDDEQQSDDEKKDDEQQSDDEKKDDEQQSDDEKKDDEQQSDDEKKDDETQSDDEKKDDEDKKSDDKDSDGDSDSDSDSKDDDNGSGDAKTNDSSTSDGNDNTGDQTASGSASTSNPVAGSGAELPVALALACGAVIIFRKRNDD